jgi:hypothetical protein
LQQGAFGGTYFRKIKSSVTGETYSGAWKEFPDEWFNALDKQTQVASSSYNPSVNKYGAKCGSGLDDWESKGWIEASAPFGWFHWYCRYFMGLRGEDDDRQISRWNKCAGLKSGRWVRNLVTKVCTAKAAHDDPSVSPVVRQTLLHWAYQLTDADFVHIARSRGMLPDGDASESDESRQAQPPTIAAGKGTAAGKRTASSGGGPDSSDRVQAKSRRRA